MYLVAFIFMPLCFLFQLLYDTFVSFPNSSIGRGRTAFGVKKHIENNIHKETVMMDVQQISDTNCPQILEL
jgi:hypothetical protein